MSAQRLFFALWPDDDTRARIALALEPPLRLLKGQRVDPARFHATMCFLGDVPDEQAAPLGERAARLKPPSLTLRLDRFGGFQSSRVAWLGASEVPRELPELATQLGEAAREQGLTVEHRPLALHVTAMRRVHRVPNIRPVEPVEWKVNGFELVRSHLGERQRYEILRRFSG